MSRTVLVLVPHPDDAEIYVGGLIRKFVAEGARVQVVIATDGSCGSYALDSETLARLRGDEARAASAALGAAPPILLGHHDGDLDKLAPGVLREQFVRLIRQARPDTVITEDPFNTHRIHPDHRAVAWAAAEAVDQADLPLIYPEHLAAGWAPHFVAEKYFYGEEQSGVNRIVDITPWMDQKVAAVAEHRSQVIFLIEGLLRQAQAAGLDVRAALGPAAADPTALLAWGLRARAAQVGQQGGFAFAEAYRYERYDPLIEALLAQAGNR